MHDVVKLVSVFLTAAAELMALVLMFSILQRQGRPWLAGQITKGILFSVAVVVTMSAPIELDYGGKFDMRGLFIGAATGLFGPITGGLALGSGLLMRWGIGGTGLIAGLTGAIFVYAGGLVYWFIFKPKNSRTMRQSFLLAVLISAQAFAIFLAPSDWWHQLFLELMPYIIVTNVLGILLINHLLNGELSFLSEAESTKIEATTDHLTGLLNRRGLDLVYPDLAKIDGNRKGRALLYFDIDHFKTVNDTHGHAVGDEVLKFIAKEISRKLRPTDVFARVGGDEFVVVLNQLDEKEAERISERCLAVIEDSDFVHNDQSLQVSISIGAIWMLEETAYDDTLDQADQALYAAKQAGRNNVVFKPWAGDLHEHGQAVGA